MSSVTDDELIRYVDWIDRGLAQDGVEPRQRSLDVPRRAAAHFGEVWRSPPAPGSIADRADAIFNDLYRSKDVAVGAVYIGVVSHLDLFFLGYAPYGYGIAKLDARKLVDASPLKWRRICSRKEDFDKVTDQVIDIWDIGATRRPYDGFKKPDGRIGELFELAVMNMEAAAAAANAGTQSQGPAYLSLVAIELSVKAMVLASDKEANGATLKNIGHKLGKAKKHVEKGDLFSWDYLQPSLRALPRLV
ncbi:MAG: hypothetical protein ACOCYW_05730, partial [Roseicyclus sp.]